MLRPGEMEPGVGTSGNQRPDKKKMPPTEDRKVVAKTNKNTVIFNEVAVYFSEEEWKNLEAWQKELYSDVMKDIHATLVSLGYSIAYPHILCRIRKEQDSCIRGRDERSAGFPSINPSVLCPDILIKIKQDDDAAGESGKINCSTKWNSTEPPSRVNEASNCNLQSSNLKIGKVTSTSADTFEESQLVFNPKFSLWIKQVEEDSPGAQNEKAELFGEDSRVKKPSVEAPSVTHPDKSLGQNGFFANFSDKENSNKKQQTTQHKPPPTNKPDLSNQSEESLLSIVLKRANTRTFYMPSYKNSEVTGKRSPYDSKLPYNAHKPITYHQAVPDPNKPYRCALCEKFFKTVGILNVHMKTHTGVRPYKCNECGKCFRDNWNLKVHQKIHTGETQYNCSICNKAFIQYATYMKHRRIHTGEKPYACCYCDKRFTNSSNLVRHHRTHTGEKPYVCMECGKCFSYNTSLIQHKSVHATESLENVAKVSEK
uniref:Uncharacterized protein n=1 Tax=Leptobrachium leishanense TaxID=445787 RepID=A0A8C5MMB1_9ANUR